MNIKEMLREYFLTDPATIKEEMVDAKVAVMKRIREEAKIAGFDINARPASVDPLGIGPAQSSSVPASTCDASASVVPTEAAPPANDGIRQQD